MEDSKDVSIGDIRKKVSTEMVGIEDPLRIAAETEWKTFCRISSSQLTPEFLTNMLKTREAYYREKATQSLESSNFETSFYYPAWSETHDALLGATGKEPISKTIGFFRKEAADWKKTADQNRDKNKKQGIEMHGGDILGEILDSEKNIETWDKIADNCNMAARLFENKPNFVVADEKI